MPHSGLSDTILSSQELAPQNASSVQAGTGVNMTGYDGVQFQINLGAFIGSAVCDARVMASANANFSGQINIVNAAIVQVAAANASNLFIIDVFRPTNLYVRCVVTPATNNVLLSVTANRYKRNGVLPPTAAALQVVKIVEN